MPDVDRRGLNALVTDSESAVSVAAPVPRESAPASVERSAPQTPREPTAAPAKGDRTREERDGSGPSAAYYDVPMLKPLVWTWEIATYFYLGGLSSGAFLLSRMAGRFGGSDYDPIRRSGAVIAVSAFLPCAPLLILDLGDRKRFHYMLRVFKPRSPMNLGAWVLTLYGGVATLAALKEWRCATRRGGASPLEQALTTGVDLLSDLAGVPLAVMLAGYTGVLLSTTATPIWARNPWIGPVFSAGAISSGAAAISLSEALSGRKEGRPARRLKSLALASKAVEAIGLIGFMATARSLARPLLRGRYAPHLWGGAVGAGLALSTLLEETPTEPGSKRGRRWLRIGAAAAGLVGGFALRWAMTQAGGESANDPAAARKASSPSASGGSPPVG